MTPERKLIEAALEALCVTYDETDMEALLAYKPVQTALAEVRGNIRNPDATDEDPMVRDVEAWLAANPPATPKPEPVLRWEGYWLFIGDAFCANAGQNNWNPREYNWNCTCSGASGTAKSLEAARTAAEQAVRDWLKRAGCV